MPVISIQAGNIINFVDSYGAMLYYLAHSLILSDEKKSKHACLAQRDPSVVQGGAGGCAEDGLGADWLRCLHLGRPGAPVTVPEY